MLDERLRLELHQDMDSVDLGIKKIGQDKVDNTILAPKGDSRLGPVLRERLEARPFTASHHNAEHFRLHAGLLSWYDALCLET